jgi:hypothetical protein
MVCFSLKKDTIERIRIKMDQLAQPPATAMVPHPIVLAWPTNYERLFLNKQVKEDMDEGRMVKVWERLEPRPMEGPYDADAPLNPKDPYLKTSRMYPKAQVHFLQSQHIGIYILKGVEGLEATSAYLFDLLETLRNSAIMPWVGAQQKVMVYGLTGIIEKRLTDSVHPLTHQQTKVGKILRTSPYWKLKLKEWEQEAALSLTK